MKAATSFRAWSLVVKCRRDSSSCSKVELKLSAAALSRADPTRLIDWMVPGLVHASANTSPVYSPTPHPQQVRQKRGIPIVVLHPTVLESLHPQRMRQLNSATGLSDHITAAQYHPHVASNTTSGSGPASPTAAANAIGEFSVQCLGDLAGRLTPEEQWGVDAALLAVLGLN